MPRAARTCSRCPAVITSGSRCEACERAASSASDKRRRAVDGNPYSSRGHQRFRRAVLRRDPICVLCRKAWTAVADHWPTSRKDLVATKQDPNEPRHGRGLCKRCHDQETARNQPGGWHADRQSRPIPRG